MSSNTNDKRSSETEFTTPFISPKKLMMMRECKEIYNNYITEVTGVPGYNPIGIAEFFKFMASKDIPQEDKDLVKKYSALHAKDPTAGHNEKINELFQKHNISLSGVIKPKQIGECVKKDILPKAGAGQDGTDTLRKSYTKDTPGQGKVKKFKDFKK